MCDFESRTIKPFFISKTAPNICFSFQAEDAYDHVECLENFFFFFCPDCLGILPPQRGCADVTLKLLRVCVSRGGRAWC